MNVAAISGFQAGETMWPQQIRREYLPETVERPSKVADCFLVGCWRICSSDDITLLLCLSPVPGNIDEPSDGHAVVPRRWLPGGSVGGEETLLLPGGQALHAVLPDRNLPR